jgi:20S proteasome alpha/beta subunit
MSLGIVVKGSEGLVLAADSRVILTAQMPQANGAILHLPVNFDNATKLLTFAAPNNFIGAVTYGDAVIDGQASDLRTANSLIPEFEVALQKENKRLSVEIFSQRLSDFFLKQWQARISPNHQSAGMVFVVGGFDEGEAYGTVFEFNIPNAPKPIQASTKDFGITMGGQHELASRMIMGFDEKIVSIAAKALRLSINQVDTLKKALNQLQMQIPFPVLPLQDCIDLAVFLIKTTTTAQNLSIGVRGVGGAIDVAVITQRDGLKIIKEKKLVAEKTMGF